MHLKVKKLYFLLFGISLFNTLRILSSGDQINDVSNFTELYISFISQGDAVNKISIVKTGTGNSVIIIGDNNITGLTGAIGATGAMGSKGATGNTGVIGDTGNTGPMGNRGSLGVTGIPGTTGVKGDTGNIGSIGATGSRGNTGSMGTTGKTGNTGLTGAKGAIGNTGVTGEMGATGAQGLTGNTGAIGNTGATGQKGTLGQRGATGLSLTGNTGALGVTGTTGVTGLLTTIPALVQLGSTLYGTETGSTFGDWDSVALNKDGTIIAVGSSNFGQDYTIRQGRVKIFKYTANSWQQLGQTITGDNDQDHISIVRLVPEGNRLVVATDASLNLGYVKVYDYNGTNNSWVQVGRTLTGEYVGDFFGEGLAISQDGTMLAIGASAASASGTNNGKAYLYQFTGSDWNLITAINGFPEEHLGYDLSLNKDGSVWAIGNSQFTGGLNNVKIYMNSQTGFNLKNIITGSQTGSNFGWKIALNKDGSRMAVGAFMYVVGGSQGAESGQGEIIVYENQSGNWNQIGQAITGIETGSNLSAIAMNDEGSMIVAGAYYQYTPQGSGYVQIYRYYQDIGWVQVATTLKDTSNATSFGGSVAMSNQGTTIALGAAYDDTQAPDAGAVYVYRLVGDDTSSLSSSDVFKIAQPATALSAGYAYVSNLANANIPSNGYVRFTETGTLSNITHTAGTTGIVINQTGTYLVNYSVHSTGAGLYFVLETGVGNMVPATKTALTTTGAAEINAIWQGILLLNKNDVILLKNYSGAVNIAQANNGTTGASASINVLKIQ